MFVCFTLIMPIYSSFNNFSYNFIMFCNVHVCWSHFIFTCECFSRTWRTACILTELLKCFVVLILFHLLFGRYTETSRIKNITLSSIPPLRLSLKIMLEKTGTGIDCYRILFEIQTDRESVLVIMFTIIFQPLGHTSFHEMIQTMFLFLA